MTTVLFYSSGLDRGGVATAFCALADALEQRGYIIKVMVPYAADVVRAAIPKRYIVGYARRKPVRFNLLLRAINLFNLLTGYRLFFLGVPRIQHDIFVVYHAFHNTHWAGYSKKPRFAWLHEIAPDLRVGVSATLWNKSESKTLNKFTNIFAVSQAAADSWKHRFGIINSPVVVNNIVPVSRIIELSRIKLPTDGVSGRRIVFVGRLSHDKGVMRLLDAFNKIILDGMECHLDIVGDGEARVKAEKFVADNGLLSWVSFYGSQTNPYPYMARADLLVCASEHEGFGLVMQEALLCGTPVLSTDCGGSTAALNGGLWGKIVENSERGLLEGLLGWLEGESFFPDGGFDEVNNRILENNSRSIDLIVAELQHHGS